MQRDDIVKAIIWSLALFFLWSAFANWMWPPTPKKPAGGESVATNSNSGTGLETPTDLPGDASADSSTQNQSDNGSIGEGGWRAQGADEGATVTLGPETPRPDSPFRMKIVAGSVGAAINSVTLSDYADHIAKSEERPDWPRYEVVDPVASGARTIGSIPIRAVTVDDKTVDLIDLPWRIRKEESEAGESAVFQCDILNGDANVLTLTRTITLPRQPVNTERHDVEVDLSITNHSDAPHRVIVIEQGPVGIQRMDKRSDLRAIDVAHGTGEAFKVKRHRFSGMKPQSALVDPAEGLPFWWAAVQNQYFAFAYIPRDERGDYPAARITSVDSVDVDGVAATNEDKSFRLVTVPMEVPAGGSITLPATAYIGPKDKDMFSHVEEYKKLGFERMVTNGYPGCTFDALTNFMIWLLNRLKPITFGNYGFAIIILVLIVRTVLHPITKKGQVNMMKMQKQMGALAPKIEEVKKKYANDKAKQSQETMKIYQEAGVNPAGNVMSCLPMVLQMPIWVALYASLNNNIDMRLEPFILWIRDLTAPDAMIKFNSEFTIPLIGGMMGPVKSLNLLPILWGVTLYFQQKYMPKPTSPAASDKMSEQMAMQQKMMPIMFGFMVVMFYNMPSGMTLYIMASTLFGTIEQMRIRKHIREMEDNPEMMVKPKKPKAPKGPGFFERMQKMAEEAQRAQSAQQKKRK